MFRHYGVYKQSMADSGRVGGGGDGLKPPPFLSTVPVPHSREIFASCCDNGHKGVAPIDVHPAVAVNQPAAPDECCFLCEQ